MKIDNRGKLAKKEYKNRNGRKMENRKKIE